MVVKKTWYHYTRSGSSEESVKLASGGLYNLNTGLRDNNHLLVITLDDEGWLIVNDSFISKLDLGAHGKKGDITAFSGYFTDDEATGAVTSFQDFTVWAP